MDADRPIMPPLRPVPGEGVLSRDIGAYPGGIVLVVDKPWRWTSADVIRKIKYAAIRHFGKKNLKVGHAGTLDPLATGVLLVCIGAATRQAERFQAGEKAYRARVRFGATTPSYDLEKEIDRTFPHDGVTEAAIRQLLPAFTGEQEQVAPLFSAKSVDGVRAYELARKRYRSALQAGTALQLDEAAAALLRTARINIPQIELLAFFPEGAPLETPPSEQEGASGRIHVADSAGLGLPDADLRIVCSKGTYIRALARDLGEALGTGAHLAALRRIRSGDFRVEETLSLDQALALFGA